MHRSFWLIAFLGLTFTAWDSASASVVTFHGEVYELGSDQKEILYRVQGKHSGDRRDFEISSTFLTPDGRVATHEAGVVKGGELMKYTLEKPLEGVSGQLLVKGKRALFSYQDGKKRDHDSEAFKPSLVAGATLIPYLGERWDQVLAGKKVKVRFAVMDRTETVGFEYEKVKELTYDGKPAVLIKMEPTSFIIDALVDTIYFVFDKKTARVLEFRGQTLPKRKVDGKWRKFDARIVYHYSEEPSAVTTGDQAKK